MKVRENHGCLLDSVPAMGAANWRLWMRSELAPKQIFDNDHSFKNFMSGFLLSGATHIFAPYYAQMITQGIYTCQAILKIFFLGIQNPLRRQLESRSRTMFSSLGRSRKHPFVLLYALCLRFLHFLDFPLWFPLRYGRRKVHESNVVNDVPFLKKTGETWL